jgi:CubicO group peptidase (beta-lactamase class C family)
MYLKASLRMIYYKNLPTNMKPVIVSIALLCIGLSSTSQTKKNDGIITDRLPAVSMDSFRIHQMEEDISKGNFPNIHSVLIARHNKLVYEKYWPGKDEVWGNSMGVIPHTRDSLHDIRSISKSIVSACVGIAIQQGKIKGVDQKVFDFFPELKKYDTGWKSMLTIAHLLSMSSGLVWNEDVPYTNPENSEIQMTQSPNPVEYVLSRPMEAEPGKVWKYNGGTTQLLAAIIEKLSGKRLDKFAATYLFQPLGITKYYWTKFPGTDMPAAASGLRLRSRDLLKFGMLYNNNGVWKGKQVIPAAWVEQSMKIQVTRPGGGYGYQFWIFSDTIDGRPIEAPVAVGNGDQRIFFDKRNDMVIVVTAGNYNIWNIPRNSVHLLKEYILPAVIKD